MAERGPPAPTLPTMCKPTKTKATEQARVVDPPQQNPPLEPEVVIVPPNQVLDPALPNQQDHPAPVPPAHIPDPPPPTKIPPAHVPDLGQLQIPPAHVPDPVQLQIPPVHVPNPVEP